MGKLKKKEFLILRKKENNGITLIALVVTIIVLLILVGVSISMLTGENGILNRAKEAKEKTEEAAKKERADLDKIEELIGESTSTEKTVEQVTDKNPGKLEEEEMGTKVINSIEDLVYFADSVTKGTTYLEQTVKLGLSLDFNSSKSYVEPYRTDYGQYGYNGELKTLLTSGEGFKPIGITTNENGYADKSFKGTFDGNGKLIKNLYINSKVENNEKDLIIGLFGYNYGTIKKLGLENCNNSGTSGENTCMVGGITGVNCMQIEECFVSGNIFGSSNGNIRCGGIGATTEESANILNCYNLATINCTGGNRYNCLGGIVGSGSSNLSNCFNNGKILMTCDSKENTQSFQGGIVGYFTKGKVEKCYNLGSIEFDFSSDKGTFFCGGIVGDLYIDGNMKYCYNKGNIYKLNLDCNTQYVRLIVGLANGSVGSNCSSLTFNNYNSYTQGEDATISDFNLYDDDAKMPNVLEILESKFEAGFDGYPILSWQVENN